MKLRALALLALIFGFPGMAGADFAVVAPQVTVSNGTSLSNSVDLGPNRLFGIVMPAAWTAANLTFSVSVDGITYNNLVDDGGAEVTVTAAASQFIVMSNPPKWFGIRWLKVRSGTSATPVNQGADRIISIVGVP